MSFLPIEHPDPPRAEVLLQILSSVLEPRSCVYAAGPLDSGKTYYERMASGDERPVRAENEIRLTGFVADLRKRLRYPVFDPGPLRIVGWSGGEYGAFFLEVIRRYVRECWFMNGWEYSIGSTKEFVLCCTMQIACFAESGERLTISEGMRLIREASDFVRGLDLDDAKLRSRLEALSRIEGGSREW